MRPTTFICALAATLELLSGTALADGWAWPIRGPVITAYRNGGDPYAAGQHRGIDIGAPLGARVVAATAGTVTFSGVVGSSGLVVSERSADGRFDLSYLHLSSASVHRGDPIAAGTAIGAVGTSGRRSAEAPHLHFGVREAGERNAYRDPLDFLGGPPPADRPGPSPAPVPVGHPAAADHAPVEGDPVMPPSPSPAPDPVTPPSPAPAAWPAPTPWPADGSVPAHQPSPTRAPAPVRGPSNGRFPSPLPTPGLAVHGVLPHLLSPQSPRAGHASASAPRGDSRTAADRLAPHGGRGHLSPGSLSLSAGAGPHGASTPPSTAHRASPTAHPHHGINVGWLAACIGLIALATALGHPDATRKAAGRARGLTRGPGRGRGPARAHGPARTHGPVLAGPARASGHADRARRSEAAAAARPLRRHPARQ